MMSESIKIKVIGVGGAGSNAVDYLHNAGISNVTFASINTDALSLEQSSAPEKLLIGHKLTRGLSAGGDASIATKAAKEATEQIEAMTAGFDIVFIVAGLGSGTGSGAAPYIAEVAKNTGALVITFSPLPFSMEGGHRYQTAHNALNVLHQHSHVTIPLPNDVLLQNMLPEATVLEAFNLGYSWIERALVSILDMIHKPGIINLDFAALKRTFAKGRGRSLFGIASAEGPNYIQDALNELAVCPLLHVPQASQVADSILINITGGRDLSLKDVNHIGTYLTQRFNSKDHTTIGAVIDDDQEQFIEITVIGVTNPNRSARKKSRNAYDPNQQVLFNESNASMLENITLNHSGEEQSDEQNRGYFQQQERTIINGEDIDIPTYLRRGIKVRL